MKVKNRQKPYKPRRNRAEPDKREAARLTMLALREDPEFKLSAHARSLGINESLLRLWLDSYAKPFGWGGSTRSYDRNKPAPAALLVPVTGAAPISAVTPAPASETPAAVPPVSAWAAKFGDELRATMGVDNDGEAAASEASSQTMVSSGPPRGKPGRKSNAERAAPAQQQAQIAPYQPRRVQLHPPPEGEQPGLPFGAPYRAEPVRREEPAPLPSTQSPGSFMAQATAEALRERDAVLTTLKILMRDGGLPGAR